MAVAAPCPGLAPIAAQVVRLDLLEFQSLQSLAVCSRRLWEVVQREFQRRLHDLSNGCEQWPVQCECHNQRLGVLLNTQLANKHEEERRELMKIDFSLMFHYVCHVRIPIPLDRHALPEEMRRKMQQHPTIQRIVAGRHGRIVVKRTRSKGWAVFAAHTIESGEFIGEYVGELLSSQQLRERQALWYRHLGRNYVLTLVERTRAGRDSNKRRRRLDNSTPSGDGFQARGTNEGHDSSSESDGGNDAERHGSATIVKTIVDATRVGNFTRLLNHSCDPNVVLEAVRVDSYIPRIVLFTSRRVRCGEELCFDYASGDPEEPENRPHQQEQQREYPQNIGVGATPSIRGRTVCHCGAASCRKFLPS